MIEDPRDVERRRLLGIDDENAPTREDLADALVQVTSFVPYFFSFLFIIMLQALYVALMMSCTTPSTMLCFSLDDFILNLAVIFRFIKQSDS